MKTEIACGKVFEIEEPGDSPFKKNLCNSCRREFARCASKPVFGEGKEAEVVLGCDSYMPMSNRNDRAMELYEKRNLDWWALRRAASLTKEQT